MHHRPLGIDQRGRAVGVGVSDIGWATPDLLFEAIRKTKPTAVTTDLIANELLVCRTIRRLIDR